MTTSACSRLHRLRPLLISLIDEVLLISSLDSVFLENSLNPSPFPVVAMLLTYILVLLYPAWSAPVCGSISVSTNTPVSLEVFGSDWSAPLRLISADFECAYPDLATSMDAEVQVGCPSNCAAVSTASGSETAVALFAIGGTAIGCDSQFANCQSANIVSISILNASHSVVSFDASVIDSIRVDDTVAIDPSAIQCSTPSDCANFHGSVKAFWSNFSVILLTTPLSSGSIMVPVPTLTWTVINRRSTRAEISRPSEAVNLKMCLGDTNVGQVSFIDPPALETALLSPSSVLARTPLPSILSLVTTTPIPSSVEPVVIRLVFTDTDYLDLWLADSSVPASGTGEIPCLSILQDMYSEDAIPSPTRCDIATYTRRKDITITFPTNSGIPSRFEMTIVTKISEHATKGSAYLVAQFDSSPVTTPYIVSTAGMVRLTNQPALTGGVSDPHFLNPGGFQIVGGNSAGVVDLRTTNGTFSAVLSGSPIINSAITSGVRIRITLLGYRDPVPPLPVSVTHADGVQTDSVVPNAITRNVIQFVLNVSTLVYGSNKQLIVFTNLPVPASGFLPTRIGVELSTASRSKPDWIVSSGDFLVCSPEPGMIVASIVSGGGGFVGQQNVHMDIRVMVPWLLSGGGKVQVGSTVTVTAPLGFSLTSGWLVTPGSCSSNVCVFSINSNNFLIREFNIAVTANNPSTRPSASENLWTIQVGSRGAGSDIVSFPPEEFEGKSVMEAITEARMEFSNPLLSVRFVRAGKSGVKTEMNEAWIWMHTGQGGGAGIVIHGPRWVEFGSTCDLGDVDAVGYYNSATMGIAQTVQTCVGITTGVDSERGVDIESAVRATKAGGLRNAAVISVYPSLFPGTDYLFRIGFPNPTADLVDMTSLNGEWRVYVMDRDGMVIAGTPGDISPPGWTFIPTHTEIAYQFGSDMIQVGVPMSVHASLTVPDETVSVSVTLPIGTTWTSCDGAALTNNGRTAVVPVLSGHVTLDGGFSTMTIDYTSIPRIGLFASGWVQYIPLPPIAQIHLFSVFPSTYIAGASNSVSFTFTSNFQLANVTILVPQGHTGGGSCSLPCVWVSDDVQWQVSVSPPTGFTAGTHTVVVQMTNARSEIFNNYFSIHTSGQSGNAVATSGFSVYSPMTSFVIVPTPNRADQPNASNHVDFEFVLKSSRLCRISGEQVFYPIRIIAPIGFEFPESCLSGLVVGAAWPLDSVVTACTGRSNRADLRVSSGPIGFVQNVHYRFGVDVTNPAIQHPGSWVLMFDDQAGETPSFPLRTFNHLTATYSVMNTRVGAGDVNIVSIGFVPVSSVGGVAGDTLTVSVPSGYTATSLCTLAEVGGETLQPGIDFTCIADRVSGVILTFSGLMSISSNFTYSLQIGVLNPITQVPTSGVWCLTSTAGGVVRDRGQIAAPVLRRGLPLFAIAAPSVYGGESVNVSVTARLGVRVDIFDRIDLEFPENFTVVSAVWDSGLSGNISFPRPNVLSVRVVGIPHPLKAGTELSFTVAVAVPLIAAPAGTNVVTLSHSRSSGDIAEASSVIGLSVVSKLQHVLISLVGDQQTANSKAEIRITFLSTSAAAAIEVTAVEPVGFDFSQAVVLTGSIEILRAVGNRVLLRASILASSSIDFTIANVTLGETSGPTAFNLRTTDANGVTADQVSGFRDGFSIPSRIDLTTDVEVVGVDHPMPARFADSSVQISVTFKAACKLSTHHVVDIEIDGFQITSMDTPDPNFQFMQTVGGGVRLGLMKSVENNTAVTVRLQAVPPAFPHTGVTHLSIRVMDGESVVATNDNATVAADLGLLLPLPVTISPVSRIHTAPKAVIAVSVTSTFPTTFTRLMLIPPLGFGIGAPSCFTTARKDIVSCLPNTDWNGEGGSAAVLQLASDRLVSSLSAVSVNVQTPRITPTENVWILVGLDPSGKTLAWGNYPGFAIDQLASTVLVYPSIPSVQIRRNALESVQMALGFSLGYQTARVSVLRVSFDSTFGFDRGVTVSKIPWDGSVVASRVGERLVVDMSINDTMPVSDYALSMRIFTPPMTPRTDEGRAITVELLDSAGLVVDASYVLRTVPTRFGAPIVATRDSMRFVRDDQSAMLAEWTNLTKQEVAAIETAQTASFREWVSFTSFNPVKVNITRIVIRFPASVVVNIAWLKLDPARSGVQFSVNLESHIHSVATALSNVTIDLDPGWTKNTSTTWEISFSATLPQIIPLPAFNFYVVSFWSANESLVEYVFRGHSLTDTSTDV